MIMNSAVTNGAPTSAERQLRREQTEEIDRQADRAAREHAHQEREVGGLVVLDLLERRIATRPVPDVRCEPVTAAHPVGSERAEIEPIGIALARAAIEERRAPRIDGNPARPEVFGSLAERVKPLLRGR